MNKRYLDQSFSAAEQQKWERVLGKMGCEMAGSDEEDIQDIIDEANKGSTIESYFSKVIQSRALLQEGQLAEHGSGFDELPAPVLSKAIHSARMAKLVRDNLEGRQLKI